MCTTCFRISWSVTVSSLIKSPVLILFKFTFTQKVQPRTRKVNYLLLLLWGSSVHWMVSVFLSVFVSVLIIPILRRKLKVHLNHSHFNQYNLVNVNDYKWQNYMFLIKILFFSFSFLFFFFWRSDDQVLEKSVLRSGSRRRWCNVNFLSSHSHPPTSF